MTQNRDKKHKIDMRKHNFSQAGSEQEHKRDRKKGCSIFFFQLCTVRFEYKFGIYLFFMIRFEKYYIYIVCVEYLQPSADARLPGAPQGQYCYRG